jgi:hypothetical protein
MDRLETSRAELSSDTVSIAARGRGDRKRKMSQFSHPILSLHLCPSEDRRGTGPPLEEIGVLRYEDVSEKIYEGKWQVS